MRHWCGLKGSTPGHELFNKRKSKDAARLAHLAEIRARLVKEGKRVTELRESIPKDMDEKLKSREKKTKAELDEYNKQAPIKHEKLRLKTMVDEEKGVLEKMNAKTKLEEINMKSVEAQAATVADGREAALDNAVSASNTEDEGFFDQDGIPASLVEEEEEEEEEGGKKSRLNDRLKEVDDPYDAVMTDAHAKVALVRDELKEKRMQHQRLLERAAEQVRDDQVESEKAFRKYLIDNKKSATEEEKKSSYLRSQR